MGDKDLSFSKQRALKAMNTRSSSLEIKNKKEVTIEEIKEEIEKWEEDMDLTVDESILPKNRLLSASAKKRKKRLNTSVI